MKREKSKGVTLIEILLVLVIIGIILFASLNYMQQRALQMRIDKTSIQMQQILNAGLSYYVKNGRWPDPATPAELFGVYLPADMISPFGNKYTYTNDANLFYVYTELTSKTSGMAGGAANAIAGTLPLGATSVSEPSGTPVTQPCTGTSNACWVVASVNIPGQNLNNATAVNFAGLYRNGACVPVPSCPVDTDGSQLKPEIIVAPVQVNGVTEGAQPSVEQPNLYPISGFTAYAKQPAASPAPCQPNGATSCGNPVSPSPSGLYWRVCLQVVTERGELTAEGWAQYQSLMVITRCAIRGEPSGSTFDWHPDR